MKPLLVLFFLSVAWAGQAQRAMLKNDTLYYGDYKLHEGQKIQLTYGSAPDKSFVFIFFGSGFSGLSKVSANAAKLEAINDKLVKRGQQHWVRARIIGGAMLGNRLWINVEPALDNNEIQIVAQ